MGVDSSQSAVKRPTMGDIAAHLGVSRQLVSAVLRDAPGASAENRARVQRAVRELGYAPHVAAQMLRRHRGRHIGVIFSLAQSFDHDLVDCLYTAAGERGYEIVLAAMTDTRDEQEAVRELRGFRTEGIVLLGPNSAATDLYHTAQNEPTVLFGRPSDDPGVDSVRSDDIGGAEDVVRHLVDIGHRDVLHIDGGDLPGARERRAGYRQSMKASGLSENIRVLAGDYTEESGAGAVAALLDAAALPTAIVAGNDRCAVGVIEMLTSRGFRVPQDVSVTGFDDSRSSRRSYRQMTHGPPRRRRTGPRRTRHRHRTDRRSPLGTTRRPAPHHPRHPRHLRPAPRLLVGGVTPFRYQMTDQRAGMMMSRTSWSS